MLDSDLIKAALQGEVLLVLVMPSEDFETHPSHEYALEAMERGLHVMLWRPEGLEDRPIPSTILDYANSTIIDGNHSRLTDAIICYMAENPDKGVVVFDGGWMTGSPEVGSP